MRRIISSEELQEILKLCLDKNPLRIMVIDREQRILYVNEACCSSMGYTEAELLSKKAMELSPQEVPAGAWDWWWNELRNQGQMEMDGIIWHQDGSSHPVHSIIRQLELDGRELMLSVNWDNSSKPGAMDDALKLQKQWEEVVELKTRELMEANRRLKAEILDRQRAETQLASARVAAEAANKAKSVFLASMTHEIRTPLNAILNMTELALETDLSAKQRRYLETVHASGRALSALVDGILDLSKIEADRIELEQHPFALSDLLDELIEIFRGKVMESRVELVIQLAPGLPQTLIGDPARLRQVLVNLLSNAFKFTSKGAIMLKIAGELNKAAGTILFSISVKDTGIGIAPDALARLFQPFTQADSSITRRYGGTGLGLTISQRLVQLMGGQIQVQSAEGKGSEFSFTIGTGYMGELTTTPQLPAAIRNTRVMVIDDVEYCLEVLSNYLSQLGLEVETYSDIQKALERVRSGPPIGLVVLDRVMAEMDGLAVAQQIRQYSQSLPIMMISAFYSDLSNELANLLGIKAFLPKPVRIATLSDGILRVLGQSRLIVEPPVSVESNRDLNGLRILVVEDNDANRFVVGELLELAGAISELVGNGEEAVEKLRQFPDTYALVLMDIHMPVMDGLTATRLIRAERQGKPLPILALTANAMKEEVEACRMAGMDDYLGKPIRRDALFAAIKRWTQPKLPDPSIPPSGTIPVVEGMDLQEAVARIGLPWPRFAKLLLRFMQSEPKTLSALLQAVEAKDYPTSRRLAHSLSGAAGTMGAHALARLARQLEQAAGSADLTEPMEAVELEAKRVFQSLQALKL